MNELENIPRKRIEYLCELYKQADEAKQTWLYGDVDSDEENFETYHIICDLYIDGILRIAEEANVKPALLREHIDYLIAQSL